MKKNQEIIDDHLRNEIEKLQTEINDSLNKSTNNSTTKTPKKEAKSAPKPPETDFDKMTPDEIGKQIDKFSNIYDRAILQAKINWDYDLADKLYNEKIDPNLSNEDIVKKVQTLESNLKRQLSVQKLNTINKLEIELKTIEDWYINELLSKNILEADWRWWYKIKGSKSPLDKRLEKINNPKIIKYFKKAFKTGG